MRLFALVIAGSVLVGLAGCGDSDEGSAAPGAATSPGAVTSPEVTGGSASPSAGEVVVPTPTARPEPIKLAVRRTTVKGVAADIVTINGWTAYRFEADEDKPSKVKCQFDCLVTWPPALTDGSAVEVSGIDRSLVGTVGRADGKGFEQVTLNGWPLYKFKEDKVPTDIKGEGVGGNWSVIKPDGKPVIKKNTAAPAGG
jgi:predicted lipoprotein with Yx(FWY)xxD motif